MRILLLLLLAPLLGAAATVDDEQILKTINDMFAAMTAHSTEGVLSAMTAEARATAVRGDKVSSFGREELAKAVTARKNAILERIWNPKILVRGGIATVWAEYDFHIDGKFSHCGIDAFSLLKTEAGWKISNLQWTAETTGCAPSPLGPPPAAH